MKKRTRNNRGWAMILLMLAISLQVQAQNLITLKLENKPLPAALKLIEHAGGKNVIFSVTETEKHYVSADIQQKTQAEAIGMILQGTPFISIERADYFAIQKKDTQRKAIEIRGKVMNEKNEPLPYCNVLLLASDSTFVNGCVTQADGSFLMMGEEGMPYSLRASYIGYATTIQALNKQNLIQLLPDAQTLEEVDVVGDKSHVVIQSATGTIFHLSKRAKSLTDPYEALMEVPKLNVIPSQKRITLSDGTIPMILINGQRINGGVKSIDPKHVESIEIIETPSARYLKDGVQAIVNIMMKRPEVIYHKLNASTTHSAPAFFGFSGTYYETGNKNASLNLSAQHWYFHNDNATITNFQQNTGYSKWRESERNWNAQNIDLALYADWMCSLKDYLAFKATYVNNPSNYISEGKGHLNEEGQDIQHFTYFNEDKVSYYINTYNLYYKHSFHPKSWLEATARFNLNGNETKGVRTENYHSWDYQNIYDFDNFRYSGGLEICYTTPIGKHTLDIGSETSFLNDRIRQVYAGYPTFNHKNMDEYLFAGLSGKLSPKFSYAFSVGYEMLFRKVAGVDYDYKKPTGNLSLNWRMNSKHNVGASYNLRHTAPNVGQLNPYNTSTDSLMMQQGNPYLLPSQSQQWKLRYSYNKRGLYIEPSLSYTLVTDAVEEVGKTDKSTGIYLSTYENSNRYSFLSGNVNLRYNNSKWGGFGLGIENITRFYEGQSGKNFFIYNLNFYGWHKRLSWDGYVWYSPIDYGVHTKTKSRGAESELHLTYKLARGLSLSAGMRYLLGTLKSETTQVEGTYSSVSNYSLDDRSWKILFGVSYSWQKEKSPNRNKKYLDTKETGIKL